MAEEYREPEIKKENGLCSMQNGTYEQVPNNEAWDCIAPLLDMVNASNDFYKMIELGSEDDIKNMLSELTSLTSQIGKVVTKIKKANGKAVIPDATYFKAKFDEINKRLENVPYKEAKKLEKEYAKELAKEFRECTRISVAHNYNEALFLISKGVKIEIPLDKQNDMQRIAKDVEAKASSTPTYKRNWNGLRVESKEKGK